MGFLEEVDKEFERVFAVKMGQIDSHLKAYEEEGERYCERVKKYMDNY